MRLCIMAQFINTGHRMSLKLLTVLSENWALAQGARCELE